MNHSNTLNNVFRQLQFALAFLAFALAAIVFFNGCGGESPAEETKSYCEKSPAQNEYSLCASVIVPETIKTTPEKVSFHLFDSLPPKGPPSHLGLEIVDTVELKNFAAGQEVPLKLENLPANGELFLYLVVYMPGGGAQNWQSVANIDYHAAASWDAPLVLSQEAINLDQPLALELIK